MIVGCPSCQTKFRLDDEKFVSDIRLRCTKCRAIFKVVKKDVPAVQTPPAAPAPSPAARLRVFVAHESAAFCAAVHKVLANEPFEVRSFTDGLEVYTSLKSDKPDVLLLDVALPSMFGFEVCENIRREPELAGIKTILIAAIYDKTRYKRTPASLYGADDYIEKHHIPDELAAKIYRLTSGQQQEEPQQGGADTEEPKQEPAAMGVSAAPTPGEQVAQQNVREELQKVEAQETTAAPSAAPAEESEAHVKARRFARIIVSDIALYNQAKVEQGVRAGTFYELLVDDITEGRNIYCQRIAEDIRSTTNYLEEALEALVAKKKKEFNL